MGVKLTNAERLVQKESGLPIRVFIRRRTEPYTILSRKSGWPESLRGLLGPALKTRVNFDVCTSQNHVILFGHFTKIEVVRALRGSCDNFEVIQVLGRHHEALPFTPQSL